MLYIGLLKNLQCSSSLYYFLQEVFLEGSLFLLVFCLFYGALGIFCLSVWSIFAVFFCLFVALYILSS